MFQFPSVPRDLPIDQADSRSPSPQVQSSFQWLPGPAGRPTVPMFQSPLVHPGTLRQMAAQRHQDPDSFPVPQGDPETSMIAGPLMHPDLQTYPRFPTPFTHPVHLNLNMPSCPSVRCACPGPQDPLVPSEKANDQQGQADAPRKQRKSRRWYTTEQKLHLKEYFKQNMNPNLQQRMELAQKLQVTEYELQVWFKNERARHNQEKSRKVAKRLPESSRSSQAVAGSSGFHAGLGALDPPEGDPTSLGTPKLKPSLEASPATDQACEALEWSPQEAQLDDAQAPASAVEPGQPPAGEGQNGPAVAAGPASAEAPVPSAAAAQSPKDAQDSGPSEEELWQRVLESLDELEASELNQASPNFLWSLKQGSGV